MAHAKRLSLRRPTELPSFFLKSANSCSCRHLHLAQNLKVPCLQVFDGDCCIQFGVWLLAYASAHLDFAKFTAFQANFEKCWHVHTHILPKKTQKPGFKILAPKWFVGKRMTKLPADCHTIPKSMRSINPEP